jgi:pimeloyl-ACP methyl ester carboxylesterase
LLAAEMAAAAILGLLARGAKAPFQNVHRSADQRQLHRSSAGPAFVQLAAQFFDEHARNAKHLPELKTLDIPVKLIWGRHDPYITVAVAEQPVSTEKCVPHCHTSRPLAASR